MESQKLNKLAQKFWDGTSTEQEELDLREAMRHGNLPAHHKELSQYMTYLDNTQSTQVLDDSFDEAIMRQIEEKPVIRKFRPAVLLQWAAGIILLAAIGLTVHKITNRQPEPVVSEFVDTFQDSEVAYMEVKKALMMVSSTMNAGMEPTEALGEFHKAQEELTDDLHPN